MSRKMRIHAKHLYYGDPFTDNQRSHIAKIINRDMRADRIASTQVPILRDWFLEPEEYADLPRITKKVVKQLAISAMTLNAVSYLPIMKAEDITETGMSIDFYIDRIQRITNNVMPVSSSRKTTRTL